MKKRVVVTGIGLITPVGVGTEATWEALMAGKSGVGLITKYDMTDFPVKIAAEVRGFDPLQFIDRKNARKMDTFIHFAMAATSLALQDSGLKITSENDERVGVYIASGIGGFRTIEHEHIELLKNGPRRISPFFIPASIINLAAGQVSIRYGAKGPNLATCTACSAGTHALGEAFKIIQRGDADVMIAGGSEAAITPMGIGGFAAMRALSTRNDAPEKSSRPFDRERDGFVVGEGSGMMILESLESAVHRDAKVYAELVGYGTSADAYHITEPSENGDGAVRVMRITLKDGDARPEDVDYINAHGTSTPIGDALETLAVKRVFGEHAYKLPVSSTKSMTGHLLGAAGGVEGAITALSIHHQMLLPTINQEVRDPDCDLDYVPNVARPAEICYALSNSFGFGGTNACLLFKRYEP
ncbi:MAG: beta-ketoacyl-ACP synthase II [Acidobacteria bacterium]|nr:beta-ketoacyl-ACP synthase II [Acidobacteriota bacterium]MBI3657404.1 beta-ketoacyl-ACP synthase II [Acidobacteriota bacterium]